MLLNIVLFYFRCNTTVEGIPQAPAGTYLMANITEGQEPVLESEDLIYECIANDTKTYIEDNPLNQFSIKCLPGGVWEQPPTEAWPICDDPTTTTAAPTTTSPLMSMSQKKNMIMFFFFN